MIAVNPLQLFSRLVFASGPPRSGTTLAMRILENHPGCLGVSDDHVHESWALYYYGNRTGILADLRTARTEKSLPAALWSELVRNGRLESIADVPHTMDWPLSQPRQRPDGRTLPADSRRRRRACALDQLPAGVRICLKSPEISHFLPELAAAFPQACFVLVFRSLEEIAESMFRMGNRVSRVAVFHRRWTAEKDTAGRLVPPPGVPSTWHGLWREVSDFGRCAIYAAAYLKAMAESVSTLPANRVFVYDHDQLRRSPEEILYRLAHWLGLDPDGFRPSVSLIHPAQPDLTSIPREELNALSRQLEVNCWLEQLQSGPHPSASDPGGKP